MAVEPRLTDSPDFSTLQLSRHSSTQRPTSQQTHAYPEKTHRKHPYRERIKRMAKWLNLAVLTALVAWLAGPLYRQLTVLGVFREHISREQIYTEGQNIFTIADTMQCEDLHYHASSNKLFTACEDSILPRFAWFPPMTNFKKPATGTGSIHVIDPEVILALRPVHG